MCKLDKSCVRECKPHGPCSWHYIRDVLRFAIIKARNNMVKQTSLKSLRRKFFELNPKNLIKSKTTELIFPQELREFLATRRSLPASLQARVSATADVQTPTRTRGVESKVTDTKERGASVTHREIQEKESKVDDYDLQLEKESTTNRFIHTDGTIHEQSVDRTVEKKVGRVTTETDRTIVEACFSAYDRRVTQECLTYFQSFTRSSIAWERYRDKFVDSADYCIKQAGGFYEFIEAPLACCFRQQVQKLQEFVAKQKAITARYKPDAGLSWTFLLTMWNEKVEAANGHRQLKYVYLAVRRYLRSAKGREQGTESMTLTSRYMRPSSTHQGVYVSEQGDPIRLTDAIQMDRKKLGGDQSKFAIYGNRSPKHLLSGRYMDSPTMALIGNEILTLAAEIDAGNLTQLEQILVSTQLEARLITGKGLESLSEVGLIGQKAKSDSVNHLTMGLGEGQPKAHIPNSVEDLVKGLPHPNNWYMMCRINFDDSEMEIALTVPAYLYFFNVSEKAKRARRSKELTEQHFKQAYVSTLLKERKGLSQTVDILVDGKAVSVPEHLLNEPDFGPLKKIQHKMKAIWKQSERKKRKVDWNKQNPCSALAKKFKDQPELYRQAVGLYQATGSSYFEEEEEEDDEDVDIMN